MERTETNLPARCCTDIRQLHQGQASAGATSHVADLLWRGHLRARARVLARYSRADLRRRPIGNLLPIIHG